MLLDLLDLVIPSTPPDVDIWVVRVPMSNIQRASWIEQVADDWLALSFVAESLAEVSSGIQYRLHKVNGTYVADVTCRPSVLTRFFERVRTLSEDFESLGADETDEDFDDSYATKNSFMDALEVHRGRLGEAKLQLPEVGDIFMANWIEAALEREEEYGDEDDDYLQRTFPEFEFGFWKSCWSPQVGRSLYMSPGAVFYQGIDLDAEGCLAKLLPQREKQAHHAARLSCARSSVSFFTKSVEINIKTLSDALGCAGRLWGWAPSALEHCECSVSEDEKFIVFRDGKATYILGQFMV